jgi:hypothetical protein
MATVTLELPENLAKRLEPLVRWMPTILEINFLSLKTPTLQTAYEVISFLTSNPTAKDVYHYKISKEAQDRVSALLDLNSEDRISKEELLELEEHVELANIVTMLKASLTNQETA